jgi:membrane protein
MKCAVSRWAADEASTIGAALAFYCAFSLAPLLIILLTIAGWFIDTEQAYGYVGEQLRSLFGPATADILLKAAQSSQSTDGAIATTISGFSLLVGATTVFAALESALERIWDSRALVRGGVLGWLRTRVLSFGVILAVGFLLLVSLTISTALAALKAAIARRFTELVVLTSALDFIATTALVTGLIALIYRYMPARRLEWRPVLWGALVTALLFQVGRWAISVYLGRSTQPSAFGAAASFAALLLWLYYSAQIFLLGAEFTACLGGIQRESPEKAAAKEKAAPQPRREKRVASPVTRSKSGSAGRSDGAHR